MNSSCILRSLLGIFLVNQDTNTIKMVALILFFMGIGYMLGIITVLLDIVRSLKKNKKK